MEITLKCNPKELADLVNKMQSQLSERDKEQLIDNISINVIDKIAEAFSSHAKNPISFT